MLILYGASGHGKVVHSFCSKKVTCFVDDDDTLIEFCNKPVLKYDAVKESTEKFIITIGDNKIRAQVTKRVKHEFSTIISDSAEVASSVQLGIGNQIVHRSLIQADSIVGSHCIINSMSSVDHDCVIEDFVHIAPNATLCGGVKVGEGTLIGAGSVVIPNLTIGKWCVIAAGSVVTKDVPDFALAVGNPARIVKYYDKK